MTIDNESKQELMDAFSDLSEEVEQTLSRFLHHTSPEESKSLLNQTFRAIHTIKGNAAMLNLDNIVKFTHAIENVAESLRSNRYPPSEAVCEAIQLGMDRLRDIHQKDLYDKVFDNLREEELEELFNQLADSPPETAESKANVIMGFISSGISHEDKNIYSFENVSDTFSITVDNDKLHHDLEFFKEIALQIDHQSHYWDGRSVQIFEWALKMNRIGGNQVSYEQLAAAIYLHDIGMSFLPDSVLSSPSKLDEKQLQLMQMHAKWGHDYLIRIPGWEEAAIIILDHHERVDGQGYPLGKTDLSIHPGAKILAILDAFFSMLNGRADRHQRTSIIRAMGEINSCSNTQFDSMWVQCFNHMIRTEVKSGNL